MHIAIYSRKSKYTGKGESIENQVEMCRAYALSHLNAAEMDFLYYEDEGFSGKSMERPQFQKLLRDARAHRFSTLVCYRLDRISRSVVDFSALVELFRSLGIGLVCIREQFDTATPMGRAMMYIASVFAQLERETIAERVRDNMMLLARDGRWLGGTPPTGYRCAERTGILVDGRYKTAFLLQDDPAELKTVQFIYQAFLQQRSIAEICTVLNVQRIPTRRGNPYSAATVRAILSNPVYAAADSSAWNHFTALGTEVCFTPSAENAPGLLCYHKRSGVSGTEQRCGPSEWIVAKGRHTPAVSGAEWVRAQKQLSCVNTTRRRIPKNNYALLSGLMVCSKCGAPFYAKPRSGREEFDYICRSKLRKGATACSAANLSGRSADQAVISAFTCRPLLPELISRLEQLQTRLLQELPQSTAHHLRTIDAEIARLIDCIAAAPLGDRSIPHLRRRIAALDQQRSIYFRENASDAAGKAAPSLPNGSKETESTRDEPRPNQQAISHPAASEKAVSSRRRNRKGSERDECRPMVAEPSALFPVNPPSSNDVSNDLPFAFQATCCLPETLEGLWRSMSETFQRELLNQLLESIERRPEGLLLHCKPGASCLFQQTPPKANESSGPSKHCRF